MRQLIYIFLGLYALWFLFLKPGEVMLGPGVYAPEAPKQFRTRDDTPFQFKGYQITPLANFEMTAKVLSKKDYNFGREAELSPVDLALGWRRMSDEAVLESIKISQSGRWYRWRVSQAPIPMREISKSSANMHMVPADKFMQSQLKRVRKGDVIDIRGELVRIDAPDGWRWISSLTRDDTGAGACELIFVRDLSIHKF